LLRTEPVNSPLAHPDALVHLIDTTLGEIFATLDGAAWAQNHAHSSAASHSPHCPCERNPLLAYFGAGKQAMLEGLILAQAATAPLDPLHRDASLAELAAILGEIATREIDAFCGVCQFRHLALAAASPTLALCGE
jgi:hypothetical protein